MKELIITTQKDLDKLPLDQEGYVYIEGGTEQEPLVLRTKFEKAEIIVRGKAFMDVRGSATISYVGGSATISYVGGSATIRDVGGSATISYVGGSATIRDVRGSATIRLSGEAVITGAYSAKKITCIGYNTVIVHKSDKKKLGLVMNKDSHLVILPDNTLYTKPTFAEYAKRFGVVATNTTATLYKAVHKRDGKYLANYNLGPSTGFEYAVGETKNHPCNPSIDDSCLSGLHVATLPWALSFGRDWKDMAILECKVPVKNIVVAKDCDGKVRTSKLTVVREVPKEEYYA